jgi:leucyl aminopeptidase
LFLPVKAFFVSIVATLLHLTLFSRGFIMVSFRVTDQDVMTQKASVKVFFVEQGFAFSSELEQVSRQVFPNLQELFRMQAFTGRSMTSVVVPGSLNGSLVTCIFVGLGSTGKHKTIDIEQYRRAIGLVVKHAAALRADDIVCSLPSADMFGVSNHYLGQQTASIFNIASYHFTDFITDSERKGVELKHVTLCVSHDSKQAVAEGVSEGECIAAAVNKARHWIDLPPISMTPEHMAERAQAIAQEHGLKLSVFSEQQINEMGMGGLAAVSRGSELDCKLIIMEYKTDVPGAQTIAFVGKGITFDSGGLSIKPADYMENMKDDMSGAAAVIATMEALARLKPKVNVIGVAPVAENMPSGNAIRPGDIVRFYNGKTAEIKNTDAEGRLILADALSYTAKHYRPDAIVDLATLTGACSYFLGPYFSGMLGLHDDLIAKVQKAADVSGDRVWRLPLHDDYKAAIVTPVADLSNTGSSKIKSGTITATWFLQNFVDDVPWVHLDIAGTAFDVPGISYYRGGATGAGIRLLIELAMEWKS